MMLLDEHVVGDRPLIDQVALLLLHSLHFLLRQADFLQRLGALKVRHALVPTDVVLLLERLSCSRTRLSSASFCRFSEMYAMPPVSLSSRACDSPVPRRCQRLRQGDGALMSESAPRSATTPTPRARERSTAHRTALGRSDPCFAGCAGGKSAAPFESFPAHGSVGVSAADLHFTLPFALICLGFLAFPRQALLFQVVPTTLGYSVIRRRQRLLNLHPLFLSQLLTSMQFALRGREGVASGADWLAGWETGNRRASLAGRCSPASATKGAARGGKGDLAVDRAATDLLLCPAFLSA